MRIYIINDLGGKCVNCGYNENINGLQIDHINGVSGKEKELRKKHHGSWYMMKNYNLLKKELQVLCGTCHCIKTRF